ncbi:MAG: ABC transporter permease [Eubacteriales bacterium]|nr:ABC transporter permease [Eubacteriales bacterium]
MKSFLAFIKKETMEQFRSGRLMILCMLFLLFGIMNPAIAKLTPWMLEVLADSLAESGMIVTSVSVSAMDSWVQFFKNIPLALAAFVLLESSIFTKEYQTGTLVLSLTKGLERYKVVISKMVELSVLWTVGYWLCFGITYAYNAYFWDNAIANHLMFSAVCWWMVGLWVVALMILFSTIAGTNTGVLIGTGMVVLASYLLGLLPKCKAYLPTLLADGNSLIYGIAETKTYAAAMIITGATSLICFVMSIVVFNKKKL